MDERENNQGHEAALARLAALAGIAPDYHDTEGQRRALTPSARAGVLRALGHDPCSPGAVRDAVAALELAPWREPLPPIAVLPPAGRAGGVAVVLAAPAPAAPLRWRIALEDGARREGSAAVETLPAPARAPAHAPDRSGLRLTLPLPADLPPGYHRLEISCGATAAITTLVQPPASAWRPDWLATGRREWGIGAALFALWSRHSLGIGDFADLGALARLAAGWGARLVGINPLHAPLPGETADPNPYRPSSRRFLNPLHLDLAALGAMVPPDAAWPPPDGPPPGAGVDYALVHRRKHAALAAAFDGGQWDAAGFAAFRHAGGEALERFALFNALAEHFAPRPWRDWPAALARPDAPGIAAFRRTHATPIAYHAWLQWIAERQLAEAARAGAGLYRDLALGVDPDGADVWADPAQFLSGARIGAPPDAFARAGQDWGLPVPDPRALRAGGYTPFIAALRANLRHAAALRIDHVMGLDRLYVIPAGADARDGAYLRYPLADLLGILTLESHRQRCLLVGEDLGTVPDGLRARLDAAAVLSTRLLLFERWPDGLFRRPGTYPRLALAAFATHDLPTFRGWWEGRDLPPEAAAARAHERALLLAALADRGLAPAGVDAATTDDPAALAALLHAIHQFLARGPSALVLASLGDLLAETVQLNHPGMAAEAANWRHRYRLPMEGLGSDSLARSLTAAIATARAGAMDGEP